MSKDIRGVEDGRVLGQRMIELVNGYQVSAAIGAVARLGVADCLSAWPAHLSEVALRVGADARYLARVVRLLTDVGLFEQLDDGRVGLTALGGILRDDVPGSARRGAILASEECHWRAYGHLIDSVRTSEPGFRQAHGCGFWEYLERYPQVGALINDSFSAAASFIAAAFVRSYDLSEMERLVDVGGGHGTLMRAVLDAHAHVQGVVLDLPGVIEGTRARLADRGLTDRCQAIAGDFFDAVPSGGDAYVLSWILHDWDEQSAVRILANCRAAMGDAGRLLAIARSQITAEWLDTETGEVSRGRITPADRSGVRRFLTRFDGRVLEVALEATTGWRFVVEELRRVGASVHLAEPAQTSALRGNKQHAKNDRADARHLRELLMTGRVPERWIAPDHLLDLRARVRLRHTLVDERGEWQQRMQAVLYHHGLPKRAGLAIDGQHIYWTNLGTCSYPWNNGTGSIGRAKLNGTGVNQSFITGACDPTEVAVQRRR